MIQLVSLVPLVPPCVPVEEWTIFSHRLIWFGREVCTAKDPRCDRCELADLCPSAFKV